MTDEELKARIEELALQDWNNPNQDLGDKIDDEVTNGAGYQSIGPDLILALNNRPPNSDFADFIDFMKWLWKKVKEFAEWLWDKFF